jgi:hypothetical protein
LRKNLSSLSERRSIFPFVADELKFVVSGIESKFKELITKGPAFDFGMNDIAGIRNEIKVLIDALIPLYHKTK